MKLNELKPNAGAVKKKMRVARGIGSGKGKTAGRGHKGQKARTGVALKGFQGGQMPLVQRLGKRGFTNIFGKEYATINLGQLQKAIDAKRLSGTATIDYASLKAAKLISTAKDGLKILGNGALKAKLTIVAQAATQSAQDAVSKSGGKLDIASLPKKVAAEKAETPAKKPAAKKAAPAKPTK
ncbi:MAG: 50S ribosomal protein L15 [Pseudomonadota bacterium]